MITSALRRTFCAILLVTLSVTAHGVTQYTGNTWLNLDAQGQSTFDMYIYCAYDQPFGVSDPAEAVINYAGMTQKSQSYVGNVDIFIHYVNIHKPVGTNTWVSGHVWVTKLDLSGNYTYLEFNDVPLPSQGMVSGGFVQYPSYATMPLQITVFN